MTHPANPVTTIVFVTAEGMPDACANGNEIELVITPPGAAVEATILIPLARAREWATETYAVVTDAYRDHIDAERTEAVPAVSIVVDHRTESDHDALVADRQAAS